MLVRILVSCVCIDFVFHVYYTTNSSESERLIQEILKRNAFLAEMRYTLGDIWLQQPGSCASCDEAKGVRIDHETGLV